MKNPIINQEAKSILNDKQLKIFEKVISFMWAGIALAIKSTLSELALAYIRSERIQGENQTVRDQIAFHLYLLGQLIDDLRDLELNVSEIDIKQRKFKENIVGLNEWSDNAYDIKNTLNDLSLVYIRSEEVSGSAQEDREDLTYHLLLLNNLIQDLSDFEEADK